jgi:FlaA1/EpsC-like NDP-sugar epimerase
MLKKVNFYPRPFLAFVHDLAVSFLAWLLAHWLRFNLDVPSPHWDVMWKTVILVVPLQAIFFWRFKLYRGIWRYASLPDLKRILMAVFFAALGTSMLLYMLRFTDNLPRSVLLLDPILLVLMMGGSRVAYRSWKEHRMYGTLNQQGQPVLILGGGEATVALLKDLSRSEKWRVVGVLDDNPAKHGRLLHGVTVLGSIQDIPQWAEVLNVSAAIMAMPSASHNDRRRAVDICAQVGLEVLTVPSYQDLLSGKVSVSQIRRIELEDLLGRDPVQLDNAGLYDLLNGKTVMVTGAGGSIGSELCRQIACFEPAVLVLFELNEFALYRMEQEFSHNFPALRIVCAIGDVKDEARLEQVMGQHRPSAVFHAAAYKHVPLMEVENAWQAVQNNVRGTYTLARVSMRHGVEKFVLISTDKAVNPTNVMGVTKRLAEMVCQGLQHVGNTRFVMVRFGNVLGSAGSVIPKFQEQISHGGPVTVTHPNITRYFMSIPEAAQLVLQAGLMGEGGEIFVLDMGEPVKIVDLAREMIRLSGFSEEDIPIEFTGLRPGEKLYEELLADDELTLQTRHPKLRIAKARQVDGKWVDTLLTALLQEVPVGDCETRELIAGWVPEYQRPSVSGADAVSAI